MAVYPEFLREGSAVRDFQAPSFVVVGVVAPDADVAQAIPSLTRCFGSTVELFVMPPEQAEMLKLVCNAWHALKVVFANEVGVLCRGAGVDSRQLMDVFIRDAQLNVGPAYLRPGFAYGGSCLGKDLRALMTLGDRLEESTYLLDAVERSNWKHIERAAEVVALARGRRLGIIGLGHKPSSGDLRSSQVLALLKFIRAQNPTIAVRAYDPHVPQGRDLPAQGGTWNQVRYLHALVLLRKLLRVDEHPNQALTRTKAFQRHADAGFRPSVMPRCEPVRKPACAHGSRRFLDCLLTDH